MIISQDFNICSPISLFTVQQFDVANLNQRHPLQSTVYQLFVIYYLLEILI